MNIDYFIYAFCAFLWLNDEDENCFYGYASRCCSHVAAVSK